MSKLKQKLEVSSSGEKVGARPYEELQALAVGGKLLMSSLSGKEVQILVDGLTMDDEMAKSLAKRVTAGKEVLLAYAESEKVHQLDGVDAIAKISDSEAWSITPKKMIKLLEKWGRIELVDSVLKVQIGDLRRYLGTDVVQKSCERIEKLYSSVSLKRR